jgi:hypothetical protein
MFVKKLELFLRAPYVKRTYWVPGLTRDLQALCTVLLSFAVRTLIIVPKIISGKEETQ